jgi:sugar phosphate permease
MIPASKPEVSFVSDATSILEKRTLSKVFWRLIPFMIFLYLLNYLDRVNISIAKLQMNTDLKFSETVFSTAVSAFYIGYCIFEVPSNLILERVGARLWIARIMISWGLVSAAMMFITGSWTFYGTRLLLGAAESGFFPGMILYISYWIPQRQRAQASAWFLTSTALSGVIGMPLAGQIMKLGGVQHLKGWQWLFMIEGLFTVAVGAVVLWYLTDKPEKATWLDDSEREWLVDHLAQEHAKVAPHDHHNIWPAFKDKNVWLLTYVYATILLSFYGIIYWTPTIIKQVTGINDDATIGELAAIPFIAAAVGMVLVGRSSDRSGERTRHTAFSCLAGVLGLVIACYFTSSVVLTIGGLSLAAAGTFATLGPFWAMPSSFLRGTAAAAGIAVINSVGNLGGGFIGPLVMGSLKDYTQTYVLGLSFYAAVLLSGFCVALSIGRNYDSPRPAAMPKPVNA